MGRGVVTGVILGAVLSGGALAALSLSLPAPREGPAELPEEVAAPAPDAAASESEPVIEMEAAPEPVVVPVEEMPAPELPAAEEDEEPAAEAPEAEVQSVPLLPEAPQTEGPQVAEAPEAGISPEARPATRDAEPVTAPSVAAIAADIAAAPSPGAGETAPRAVLAPEPEQPEGAPEEEGAITITTVAIEPVEAPRIAEAPEAPVAEAPPAAPEALPVPRIEEPEPEGDVIVISDAPAEAGETAPEMAEAEAEDEATSDLPPEGPAIEVSAIEFEPTARPAMGIVLADDGPLPAPELVAGLPFALTVVIDPLASDAAERMAFWREAGAEIALEAALPAGATASDAATALDAWRRAVPWAVAAVEETPGAIQSDRQVLGQVLSGLGETGHGLLVHSRGLNSARAEAEREGVPAGLIFRDIDGAGETPVIIRRFLDQAAFRASRNDGVILKGRTTPETIETIRDWSREGRGRTIAIAPLSAMLPRPE